MGKTVTGGSKHEKNIELLSKDQKRFLSDVLSSGSASKSKRAYQGFLENRAPFSQFSEKDLDKMLGSSKSMYKDVMSSDPLQKYWDKASPTRDTYRELMSQGNDEKAFKTGVVDPMMQQYNQSVLPALQQRFVDANAGSSSALNQALASSANDLTTQMGSMYLPFMQGQQQTRLSAAQGLQNSINPYMQGAQQQQQTQLAAAQGLAGLANPYLDLYKQSNANKLSALSGLGGLAGQQTFTPLISQQSGILGPTIGAAGTYAAASALAASSEDVKENIRPYDKGLSVVKGLDVKIYDYIPEFGGEKNKVGIIAEKVPQEIQGIVQGVRAVDLYGLVGLLINAVKELSTKVEELEKIV